MQKALNDLWSYTGELFEMDEVELALMKEGIAPDLVPLKARWENEILKVLCEATLLPPEDAYMQSGGRKGVHTEHMGHLLSEMQYLQRTYPDAKW
jgi:ring-1,2-phenylacetyl-CoA epoxidase subunit PaaC